MKICPLYRQAWKYCFVFLLICNATFSSAQLFDVNKEDAKLAESLKKKYPKESAVCLSGKNKLTFTLDATGTSPVLANENISEEFISLKDNNPFDVAVFYDEQSEVVRPKAFGAKKKPFTIFPIYKDYEENGIFFSDAKYCYFSVPVSTRGEKFSYEYLKKYKDYKYLSSIFFADHYPVSQKVVTIEIPKWLSIDVKEFNFDGYDITKDSSTVNDITTITYTAKDLPEIKSEKHSPNPAKYSPHLIIVFNSYKKNNKEQGLMESVDDLYAWYHGLVTTVKNDRDDLKTMVTQLTAGKTTDVEKVESIFYWVQENIRYIAFENGIMGYKPEAAQTVFKNRYGDCKGMANLTKEMLCTAGYDARLTWIGTNDIPYDYSLPSMAVDNHMICTLLLNGKKYFLDATESFIAFNDYAHRIQGRQVLIEDGAKYILDTVPVYTKDRNKVVSTLSCSFANDKITGKADIVYNGEEKTGLLNSYEETQSDKREEELKKYLSGNDKNIKLSNITYTDFTERRKSLEIKYDFELSNQTTSVGKEIYLNFDTDKEFMNFDFDSTRVNDYEFDCKKQLSSTTVFTVPSGYKVDYIPKEVSLKSDDFSFNLKYVKLDNKITYTKDITIDNAIIRKKDFKTWNSYIKQIKNFYTDQIILIKI